jgi:hypothetical protein
MAAMMAPQQAMTMHAGDKRPAAAVAAAVTGFGGAQKRALLATPTQAAQQRPPVSPVSTPSPGARLAVLQKARVRQGCEMSSPAAGELEAGVTVEVLDAAVNANGVVRVKVEAGWVSMATAAGEQLLEAIDDPALTEEERVLEELMDMYKQKHGKDPTDDVVKQWVATMRDSSDAEAPKSPARPTPTPHTSPAKAAPARPPSLALLGGMPPNLGLTPGPKGDPLGLGQAHLKASDLGLPSFGTQATPSCSPAKPAQAPNARAAAIKTTSSAPQPANGYADEMLALNAQFKAWVEQQLQLPDGPYDLSPGLHAYIKHADSLREKHAGAAPTASGGAATAAMPANAAPVSAPAAAANTASDGSDAFAAAQERALASKTDEQQQAIKNKFKEMMNFMSKGMELLKRDHGEDYEVTPEDIDSLKQAWAAVSQM